MTSSRSESGSGRAGPPRSCELVAVATPGELGEADSLVLEYLRWIGREIEQRHHEPFPADALHAASRAQLASLQPPTGRFYLARLDGRAAGVAALRTLHDGLGEIKRMYVRPHLRGRGVGRALLDRLIVDARELGHRRLVLETVDFMVEAHRLYRACGFRPTPAYENREWPPELDRLLRFMELRLDSDDRDEVLEYARS